MLVLRQTVSNLVVITFLGDKNVLGQRGLGWRIKRAHRYRGPILKNRVPE